MKAVIVDDSEIDRENLHSLLGDHEEIEVVGEAYSVETAVEVIRSQQPDLIFLDLHLNKEKGFSVLSQLDDKPLVIITTAHPNYALKGFAIDAVDYILKPVMEENLARAVGRLPLTRSESGKSKLYPDDLQLFKANEGFDVVKVEDISLIKGERIYTKIYVRDGSHYLHKYKMREWRSLLSEKSFVTLDRSSIVNIRAIQRISEGEEGGYTLHFDNESIPSSPVGKKGMKALRDLM